MLSVQRLSARAELDDSPETLAHAQAEAAAGDESWEQWAAEYQRGEALIIRMELSIEFVTDADEVLIESVGGFFVETDHHPPNVEQQIAELASGEFVALGERLGRRGHHVDLYALGEMYVHVELGEEIRRQLGSNSS